MPGRRRLFLAAVCIAGYSFFSGTVAADLIGHGGMVRDISISPDGGRVLTASFDYSVQLWDFGTQQRLKILDAHTGPVNAGVFLPDGKRALTAGNDGAVLLWDLEKGSVVHEFRGHTKHILELAVAPDGKTFASASWDRTVRIWNLADGTEKLRLKSSSDVNTLTFTHSGDLLFSGHKDGMIRVWNTDTGLNAGEIYGHEMAVTHLSVSEDGSRLISAGIDGSVRIWSLPDRSEKFELWSHEGPVYATAFTKDGLHALSGGRDGSVILWDIASGRALKTIQAHEGPVWAVSFSPDQRFAISSGSDEKVRVWHLETGERIGPTEEEAGIVEPKPWLTSSHPGARLYRKCAICHTLDPNGKRRSGPHLKGLFGRASGSVEGYNYSSALRTLGVTWTPETVRRLFALGPDAFVPGTKMPIQMVRDPAALDQLIDYLKELTQTDSGG